MRNPKFGIDHIIIAPKEFSVPSENLKSHRKNSFFAPIEIIYDEYKDRIKPLFEYENLQNFKSIFAAAGHPNAVFEIDFKNLKALTSGETKEITE